MEILQDTHIWLVFSFLVFLAIVWRFGRPMIANILDSRIEQIRRDIETAENLRVEAQELLAQYQRKQRDAMKEAKAIIEQARTSAEDFRKQAEADLKDNMKRREKQLKERLSRMEQDAIEEIQRYAAELAVNATARIIAEELDKKSGAALIDKAIKDIDKNLH